MMLLGVRHQQWPLRSELGQGGERPFGTSRDGIKENSNAWGSRNLTEKAIGWGEVKTQEVQGAGAGAGRPSGTQSPD